MLYMFALTGCLLFLFNEVSASVLQDHIISEEEVFNAYNGPYRPQIHFSPPSGFMNDPNGLFKDSDGIYHLYYQLNPTDIVIGNQHWGHATSNDLYNWKNQPIAIAPENSEEAIFSGSAVVDRNNTSGFFPEQKNGVVVMYTLNTPNEQAQHIAYSTDGGFHFVRYTENAVISVDSANFRDPKLFWHAPTARWVAVIAFAQDYVIGIWTSSNLREWNHVSNFSHEGILGLQYECPSLVPIPVLKNSSLPLPALLDASNFVQDADVWLMFISINPGAPLGGSASQYIPGHFNGTHFTPLDSAARLADFSKDNYAGQFFAEIPANEPQLSIQWASNWQYANSVPTGNEGFRGVMALPRMHVLGNITRTSYALFSIPVSLEPLRSGTRPLLHDEKLANSSSQLEYGPMDSSGALAFSMLADGLSKTPQGSFNFTVLSSMSGERIHGGFLFEGDSTFFIDRSGLHGFQNPFFTGQFSAAHPIDQDTHQFRMDVVLDRSIIEIFLDNGARSGTVLYYSTAPMDTLSVASSGLEDGVRVEVEVWDLRSIWLAEGGYGAGNLSQIVQRKLVGDDWKS